MNYPTNLIISISFMNFFLNKYLLIKLRLGAIIAYAKLIKNVFSFLNKKINCFKCVAFDVQTNSLRC